MMRQIVQQSEWIIPAVLLFAVAWNRFNSPPTNRSGTTFLLFLFGVSFYYALILALWIMVIVAVSQGSIGFDWLGERLTNANPQAQEQLRQYAPVIGALIVVVASQFRQLSRIETAARSFCLSLAAIPREADRLALELAQSADFQPQTENLRDQVTRVISANVGHQALNFSGDGTVAARFTRAVALYWLFLGPKNNGKLTFAANAHGRAVYARITQLCEATVHRADARYGELMRKGLAYFTSQHPTKELEEALRYTILDVSSLICALVARFVLCCEVTRSRRRQRLSSMGFDASHPLPNFGRDQWVTTILAVILLSAMMMDWMPGTRPLAADKILIIAITFGLSMGFAVLGAILVAQRFIERREGERLEYPPIAELALAGLIVAGLSVALRIGIPLVPALIIGGSDGLQDVVTQFVQRWPGIIVPFTCTVSLGLLCSYLGSLDLSWQRVAAIGALGNGIALMGAGRLVGSLLPSEVLAQFYTDPGQAFRIIVITTGTTGLMVGGMVLAAFTRSQRARKDIVARSADRQPVGTTDLHLSPPTADVDMTISPPRLEASPDLGGYTQSNVDVLEGLYVCFRPSFTVSGAITAYLIAIRWDEARSCLIFEERERPDAGHTQGGRVYLPDAPFMSLVTIERGAVRLIVVSRPDGEGFARGLITTLANPGGMHFTPASAPIVLRRIVNEEPRLGFIRLDTPDYRAYVRQLETVMPWFGLFTTVPRLDTATQVLGTRAVRRTALDELNGSTVTRETDDEQLVRP